MILLLIAGSTQLKAQQIQLMPDMKLNNGLQKNYLKIDSSQKLTLLKLDAAIPSDQFNLANPNKGIIVYSTMPVLKLSSLSVEHMPVAGMGKSNMQYMMSVEKVTVINPLAPAQKNQP